MEKTIKLIVLSLFLIAPMQNGIFADTAGGCPVCEPAPATTQADEMSDDSDDEDDDVDETLIIQQEEAGNAG